MLQSKNSEEVAKYTSLLKQYCDVWAKVNYCSGAYSYNIQVSGNLVTFNMSHYDGVSSPSASFDLNLIDKYGLIEFEAFAKESKRAEDAAKQSKQLKINELKNKIVNSPEFAELSKLLQKDGKFLDLNGNYYPTFSSFPYPYIKLS